LHEMDHLNGICFTDIVSPIKLDMAKRKVAGNQRKMKKNRAA
jgi:peptide deformylase